MVIEALEIENQIYLSYTEGSRYGVSYQVSLGFVEFEVWARYISWWRA